MRLFIATVTLLMGLISSFPIYAFGQQLTPEEKKIIDIVDKNSARSIELLKAIVDIDSPTEDIPGVKKVGVVFAKEFESIGMKTRWVEMPAEMRRAGHLIAETSGTEGKRVLILGHLDTVLKGEPFRRDGNNGFGTGIGDMKGGDVIALEALRALHEAGLLKDTRIIVMFTGDEENSGDPQSISRGEMVAAAKRSDLALSFEGTVRNTATVGRRGASSWKLVVESQTGHSSGIFKPSMGYGAIFEASRILNEFREKVGGEKYLTFNPSLFVGGTTAESSDAVGNATGKTNVVPAKVIVDGDLRFISEEQKESARAKMREVVAKSLNGTKANITFEDGIPAMTPLPGNYELLKQFDQVSRDLGFGQIEALDPGDRGAGDIAYISGIIPGLDGIGMGGGQNSHAKGESASLDTMPTIIKRAAIMIYRLTR